MNKGHAEASASINASPKVVYTILSDYRRNHPNILPKKFFTKIEVEEGGIGAGTRVRFEMKVMGSTRTFRSVVSEPDPGRVLVEFDIEQSTKTTFTVDPAGDGSASHVKIETEFPTRGGILGKIESFLTSTMLRKIYREEFDLLEKYAPGKMVE